MLLPHMRLRRLWLERCWRGYPLYDPPHKREERVLSKAEAAENFEYFMSVRRQRHDYFIKWMDRHFGIDLTPDEKGIRALNRWGNKYGGMLLSVEALGPASPYFTYSAQWTEENTGNNIVFDMGIALGEAAIAKCPDLRWDFDPLSSILPRIARRLKREPGTSFQRPMLTGFNNPACNPMPLHGVYLFVCQMARNTTTLAGLSRHHDQPRGIRNLVRDELLNEFNGILASYRGSDPYKLWGEMEPKEYLKLVDADLEERGGDDE
jgi:hypothetical protein